MPDRADQTAAPSAQRLVELLSSAWMAQAASVAARLGVADLLRDGPRGLEELAAAAGAHAPSLRRVLRALASIGIFAEDERGRFSMTEAAGPLRSDAPDTLRAFAVMQGEQWVWRSLGEMLHSARTGGPGFDKVYGMPVFDYYAAHPEAARVTAESHASRGAAENAAILAAWDFSAARTVVDLGGGQGSLLTAILRAHPAARGVLFDLPHMVAMARSLLETAGLAGRCEAVAGDFFAAVPPGGDLYLMKKVVHDWDDAATLAILRSCRAAIPAEGRLMLAEWVIPPGNTPHFSKRLDLLMLVYTGGRERTEAEHAGLLAQAGFSMGRVIPTATALSLIEAVPA